MLVMWIYEDMIRDNDWKVFLASKAKCLIQVRVSGDRPLFFLLIDQMFLACTFMKTIYSFSLKRCFND